MKPLFCKVTVFALLILALSCGAQAQVSMWFTDVSGNSVDEITVRPGDLFAVQVWTSTTVANNSLGVAVGFDRCTKMGSTYNNTITPLDNKLQLANNDIGVDVAWGNELLAMYPSVNMASTAGLRHLQGAASDSSRPYGMFWARSIPPLSPKASPVSSLLVATVNMKNNMANGEQYDMLIWDAGWGSIYTSVLNVGNGTYPRTSDSLIVKSFDPNWNPPIPEPSSLLALGGGLMGLGAFLRRRK